MPDEEKKTEETSVPETEETVKEGMQKYFDSVGISPKISRNSFGTKEALETFAKAGDELRTIKNNKDLMAGILDKAWEIFKLLT